MEPTVTDTKDEYQKITTRSGGLYQRSTQKSTPKLNNIPNNKLIKNNNNQQKDVTAIYNEPQNMNTNDSTVHKDNLIVNEQEEMTSDTMEEKQSLELDKNGEENTKIQCHICQKEFNSNVNLERHLAIHSNERQLRCKVCSSSFTTNGKLHRHMRSVHNSNNSNIDSEEEGNTSTDSSNISGKMSPIKQRKSLRTKRRYEFNNNNYNKRKSDCLDTNSDEEIKSITPNRRRLKVINNNNILQKYHCPVCNREDFASLNVLETHLEEQHPDYQIKCEQCNLGFKNHRVLNLHRFMVHPNDSNIDSNRNSNSNNVNSTKKSIMGFKDLTFVDFSSGKFPIIAKTICENSLHCPTNENDLNFQCDKCKHSFPCASALEMHQENCYDSSVMSSDEDNRRNMSDEEIKRSDFFAGLQLQNKVQKIETVENDPITSTFIPKIRLKQYLTKPELLAPSTHPIVDNTKDLADIQSIISVTSAQSLLQQLTAPKSTPPQLPLSLQLTPPDTHPRNFPSPLQHSQMHEQSLMQQVQHEEEQQDQFASEFRKMKLRGEFPCRLCTAVFPNLRALKGHNRAHLTGNGNGPYRCNMCPHSSTDKAALVRHMRTHNGDRPYECSLCNYAFTTKANCERHLRNRHRKVTRDEVKRAIIYHPSEDPTNDESLTAATNILKGFTPPPSVRSRNSDDFLNTKISHSLSSDAKRSLIFPSPEGSSSSTLHIPNIRSVISKIQLPNNCGTAEISTSVNIPIVKDEPSPLGLPISLTKNNLNALKEHRIFPKLSGALNLSNNDETRDIPSIAVVPKIQVKNFSELKQPEPEMQSTRSDHSDSEAEDSYSNRSTLISTPLSHFSREHRPVVHHAPIDLSMDVLDLSKKKRPVTPEPESDEIIPPSSESPHDENTIDEPQDLTKKTLTQNFTPTAPCNSQPSFFEKTQFLLAQQLLKRSNAATAASTPPPALNPNFYASQLQNFYNNARPSPTTNSTPTQFPNIPGFGLNPYFLQPHPFLTPTASPQEFQEIKERIQKEIIRGLQMSGGGLIMEHLATERLQAFQKQTEQKGDFQIKPEETPLTIETNPPPTIPYNLDTSSRSPIKPNSTKMTESIVSHTPNSVKMVIKNGVLMPKQKQRRYRTERPFSCEHCSARFTLRSNMERHIKQQHPQFWSQRQRSNMSAGVPGRKPSLQILPSSQQPPNYEGGKSFGLQKEIPPNFTIPNLNELNKQPLLISEQVKFAILAQQLKQQLQNNSISKPNQIDIRNEDTNIDNNEEEEENDMLVIDENSHQSIIGGNDDNKLEQKPSQEPVSAVIIPIQQIEQKKSLEQKMNELRLIREKLLQQQQAEENLKIKKEEQLLEQQKQTQEESVRNEDLVPVSKLLDNAAQIPFREYFRRDTEDTETPSEEDEEGLVASGSTSEGNISGSDGNRSESEVNNKNSQLSSQDPNSTQEPAPVKKKSAYSLAPNRVTCPYCHRKFPWSSSLRRHILTHTGQKPFKCSHCPLLFTTKSNCDRHLLRKHGNVMNNTTTNNNNNSNNNNQSTPSTNVDVPAGNNNVSATNYMTRNVPERPFKCSNCPSSTFSTLSNLKKHMSCKHSTGSPPGSISPTSSNKDGSADDRKLSTNTASVYDSHSSEDEYHNNTVQKLIKNYKTDWEQQIQTGIPQESLQQMCLSNTQTNTDLPFKCHLCDSSYGERQDALDHIKSQHTAEYELLMSKGALENQAFDQTNNHSDNNSTVEQTNSDEHDEQTHLRGKFPDYANRKVMCAFCMRRFWSAEDLRRHMRTHTGERPFSCDVCRRRFTLKHSMLRHRKKHNSNEEMVFNSSPNERKDEEPNMEGEENGSCIKTNHNKSENNNNILIKPLLTKETEESDGSGDLISNLLGIRDSSIIDQVLRSSADDAAKLLGVNNKNGE